LRDGWGITAVEDSEYFRQRAEFYLRIAQECTVPEIANALLALAADYLDYASEIVGSSPLVRQQQIQPKTEAT
jgi:hypothetical protein